MKNLASEVFKCVNNYTTTTTSDANLKENTLGYTLATDYTRKGAAAYPEKRLARHCKTYNEDSLYIYDTQCVT